MTSDVAAALANFATLGNDAFPTIFINNVKQYIKVWGFKFSWKTVYRELLLQSFQANLITIILTESLWEKKKLLLFRESLFVLRN